MQGTVMKITNHCIVVLTENGQFRNIPHRSIMPELGEQIELELQEQARRAAVWYQSKLVVAVASLLIIIGTVWLSSSLTSSSAATSVVAIDINPSIELSVNNEGLVSDVELINDDAKWLLAANDLVGKDIVAALEYVLQQAETQGYLNRTDKSDVWLTGVYLTEDAYVIDYDKLTQNYPQYEFHRLDGDADKLKQAKQVQLSLNKFLVYEMMQDRGIELELEELRSKPLRAVLQKHREEELTDDQDKHDPITIDEVHQSEIKVEPAEENVESGAVSVKEQQGAAVDKGDNKEKEKEKDSINQQSEHRNPSKDKHDKRKDHREEDDDDDEDDDDEKDADKDRDREDEGKRKSEHHSEHKSYYKRYDADKDDDDNGKKYDKNNYGRKDDLPKDKHD